MRNYAIKYFIYLILSALISYNCREIALSFNYELFKEYCNSLMVVSGMVFTLMGIWIAFLYPNSLEKIKNPSKVEIADFSDSSHDLKRLNYIVGSILKSLFIMCSILIIYASIALFKNTSIYNYNYLIFKKLAVFSLMIMLILQIECIFSVAKSNIDFLNDIHTKKSKAFSENDY